MHTTDTDRQSVRALLHDYRQWEAERRELSAAEERGDQTDRDAWEGSDDEAARLVRLLARQVASPRT